MEDYLKIDTEEAIYDDDFVAKAALDSFGIKYLFPWQRLVIANILEAYEYHSKINLLSDSERLAFERDIADSFCKGRQIVLLR